MGQSSFHSSTTAPPEPSSSLGIYGSPTKAKVIERLEIRAADPLGCELSEYPVFLVSGSTTVAEVWGAHGAKNEHARKLAQAWNERDGLLARIAELEQERDRFKSASSVMYGALEDASTVVDKGSDEDYAYQAELEFGASALGLSRDPQYRLKDR